MTESSSHRPVPAVTIVIPVYGNVPLVSRAISSVLNCVDLSLHKLIVVNDLGPEAGEIRQLCNQLLSDRQNAIYVENTSNKGFVHSCNAAVFEFDSSHNDVLFLNSDAALTSGAFEEMVAVLNLSERHAAVAPRTNHGTISTFPLYPRGKKDENESYALHHKHKLKLPRYSLAPVAPGFCLLLRRQLIEAYGLFDVIYSPGYDEENDFCLRVNELGYSAVLANHAFVYHAGSASFSHQRKELQYSHSRILEKRFPHFSQLVDLYLRREMSVVDKFVDYLDPVRSPKILIDCRGLRRHLDGTSHNILSFIHELSQIMQSEKTPMEVTLLASRDAIHHYKLGRLGFHTVTMERGIDDYFDIGFAVSPVWNLDALFALNAHCARIVLSHLDVIALRIGRLKAGDSDRITAVLNSIEWADFTIFISESARADLVHFDPELSLGRSVVIHQGSPELASIPRLTAEHPNRELGFSSHAGHVSVLIPGNSYPHKQVERTLAELADSPFEVIALGGHDKTAGNIRMLKSGALGQGQITQLYSTADVIVFPSAYEGFGLPMLQALSAGKPLVVFDTATAREVLQPYLHTAHIVFFTRFAELPRLIQDAATRSPPLKRKPVRTLSDYNVDVFRVLAEVASRPVDVAMLKKRDRFFQLAPHPGSYSQHATSQHAQLARKSVRFAQRVADLLWGPIYQRRQRVTASRQRNTPEDFTKNKLG